MTVKTGQAWAGLFVTLDATGAASAADSTPTGTLYVDGVSDAATVTITGSNPYKFAVTLPTLTAGQRVDMYIAATIDTIATAGIVASEQADTSLLSDGVTLADDAITSAKFDESTAFPVKSADTGTTAIARVGADSDTLETLSDEIAAMKGAGWTTETLKAIKDAVDAISAGSGASVDQIWNELTATHTTVGSFAKAITDILQDTGTDIPALITALGAWQATNVTTAVSSGSITDIRGSSWSIPITDLTLDTNKQQFVIKRNVQDADTAALLFVDSATGLIYINGAAGTAGDATLVYAGTTLTLTVKPGATAQLPVGTFHYGIQSVTAAGAVEEPYGGIFTISGDYVRAIT